MRRFSSLPSRLSSTSTATRIPTHPASNHPRINHSSKPFPETPKSRASSSSNGKLTLNSTFTRAKKINSQILSPVDHQYVGKVLGRKDWFLLLNHELKAQRVRLDPRSVVSVMQNQENPIYPLRFYLWVSRLRQGFLNNESVKTVLADRLYRKGPVVLSAELVQEITSAGFQIDEDLLCILMGSWGKLGLAKYCVEVFGQISFLGINPTTRLYNAVIDALVKSNAVDLAYLKFQQMAADCCCPDRFTYNILINGVCRSGVVDEALRLIKQMEKSGHYPNVFTYTILIDGFCNAKRFEEAFGILNVMRGKKVNPNEATYRSLVHGVFRHKAPLEAFEMFSSYVQESHTVPKSLAGAVLYCLSSNFMPKEAATFFRDVSEKGYLLDSPTFNILMSCWIKGLDLDETCELCDHILNKGVKLGFNSYLALVQRLYASGKNQDGNLYLHKMSQDGLISNVVSYNMIIDCFSKCEMVDRASEKLMEMHQRGIEPNLVTFNCLISGHCKVGDINEARKTLEMLLENRYKPDKCTFSSVIDGLCRVHQTEDAFDCFNEMSEWGISPNVLTYNILIRSLCDDGDVAGAERLLRKMQKDGMSPDVFSFNALIQSFCRMKKVQKAMNLVGSMLILGLHPDNFTYSAIIKTLFELGRTSEAVDLYRSMEGNGCIPDAFTSSLVNNVLNRQEQSKVPKIHINTTTTKRIAMLKLNLKDLEHYGWTAYMLWLARYSVYSCRTRVPCFYILCLVLLRNQIEAAIWKQSLVLEAAAPFAMAFPVDTRHWLFVCGLIYVSVFSCLAGEAYGDASKEEERNPALTGATAMSCFDDNYMYSKCEEPYRLDIQGSINVPPDYTDEYCNGPCFSETHKVLDCLEHSSSDFEFYNKATVKDVRATLKAACGHGSERGNFDVAEHIGSEESNAARANSVAFGIILLIILRKVLFC